MTVSIRFRRTLDRSHPAAPYEVDRLTARALIAELFKMTAAGYGNGQWLVVDDDYASEIPAEAVRIAASRLHKNSDADAAQIAEALAYALPRDLVLTIDSNIDRKSLTPNGHLIVGGTTSEEPHVDWTESRAAWLLRALGLPFVCGQANIYPASAIKSAGDLQLDDFLEPYKKALLSIADYALGAGGPDAEISCV